MARLAARRRRRQWLALDVETENEVAIRVYTRLGYTETARYSWYAGQTPAKGATGTGTVKEVPPSRMGEMAAWVAHNQASLVSEVFPPTDRRLSHFEIVTNMPGSPEKTWELSISGVTGAVIRGSYLQVVQTGYLILASADPAPDKGSLDSLMAAPVEWLRSLGGTRVVVATPVPLSSASQTMAELGLPMVVSTTLMTRRADDVNGPGS